MTFTGTSDLYVVELVLYLLVSPIALYLGYRHALSGALGYFYLVAACGVRIAADIVSLLPANRDATRPSISTAVLASIGLSPLLLALGGFLHEAHVRLVEVTHGARQANGTKRWLWIGQFQIHGISILGMVLSIVGNIKLATSRNTLTTTEIDNDEKLRSAGSALLLVLWAILAQYALYLLFIARQVRMSSSGRIDIQPMVGWILVAMPFAGLRCIASVLYTFDHKDSELNPITGALWVKVVLVVLASLGAVISMCISGWVSRGSWNHSVLEQRRNLDNVRYETVMPSDKQTTI